MNPLFETDFYKTSHYRMYPEGTSKIYSNLTPRKSRFKEINHIVVFGIQYWLMHHLIGEWNMNFFRKYAMVRGEDPAMVKGAVIAQYLRTMDNTLGKGAVTTAHIEALWDLGYIPLQIKVLPEGTLCPIGVPCLTITNTVPHAYWLVNYLETILSCTVWQPITSATLAYEYRKLLTAFAVETTGSDAGVQWQGHDFSMRGMSSLESACTSGAGHLLSFTGTDTIPAISFLEQYYGADVTKELVGASVPATEHSVMCMGTKGDELGTFTRLLEQYPHGILSVVSDTWDLWKVLTEFLPALKGQILAREGKLVIRPDSGDPVDIICGTSYELTGQSPASPSLKGVVELLWDVFEGEVNEQGYKVLDSHVGAIYGDSINLERAFQICTRLKAKGFASTNIVLGIGSYTYQMNTRDTFGFAVKATYGEVVRTSEEDLFDQGGPSIGQTFTDCRKIFKDPITDDGTKKSAKGLLRVDQMNGELVLRDQVTKEEEEGGELKTVFLDGQLTDPCTLSQVRERLAAQMLQLTH